MPETIWEICFIQYSPLEYEYYRSSSYDIYTCITDTIDTNTTLHLLQKSEAVNVPASIGILPPSIYNISNIYLFPGIVLLIVASGARMLLMLQLESSLPCLLSLILPNCFQLTAVMIRSICWYLFLMGHWHRENLTLFYCSS